MLIEQEDIARALGDEGWTPNRYPIEMTGSGKNFYEPNWTHKDGWNVIAFNFDDRGDKGVRMALYSKKLSRWKKLAHYIMCNNVAPTKNCNELHSLDLYVMSKLDGPELFNLPMVIEGEMRNFLWEKKTRAFPFPILVSKILEKKLEGKLDSGGTWKWKQSPAM